METMTQIQDLCRTFTSLTEDDIVVIHNKREMLQSIADLAQANVFIDCPNRDGKTMVVVAEAVPTTIQSLYQTGVIGKIIFEALEPAVFRSFRTGKPTMGHRALTHEGKHVKQNVTPILNKAGQTIGLLILEQDITRQVKRENELALLSETTEDFYRTFWDFVTKEQAIPDIIEEALILLNEDGTILYANNFAIGIMESHGQLEWNLYRNRQIRECLPFIEEEDYSHDGFIQREVHHLGKVFIIRGICLKKQDKKGDRFLFTLRDVTELRNKERQLMVKSAVIKEIHHRVKNNLQTVASLLRLQIRRGVSEEAKQSYQESLNRIISIATVHEVLSYSGMERVSMDEIIHKIAKALVYNLPHSDCRILLEFETEPLSLHSDQAISLALILTELIQNCLKHAFVGREIGVITVGISLLDDQIRFFVQDNGVGLQETAKTDQLGLEIIQNLTKYDLSGIFELKPKVKEGTTASVMFPFRQEDLV
ncbi:sensor histidine kinase [Ammoniphilus sp. YIM 78166]|uniref:sensor histidine kinase n=1 Tax=Ammoniphilus sp. YIM 78166 TaxID=1644106 RepID=UPI00106FA3E9|nr:sensor histidine kinase [Ammoniphilus sp. YIM 78166]